jgi:hypothetical protein
MLLPKEMIVDQLRSRGDMDAAERAERELGEKVDTEQDAEPLAALGVDVQRLEDDFGDHPPPTRAARLVHEWAALHRPELEENWRRCEQRLPLEPVEPLA